MLLTFLVGTVLLQEPVADLLDKPVTIRADVAQIAVVAGELTKQLGISIEISPKLRDELVILYAKERPAKEVLHRLASHFGWEWEKTARGYRLVQFPSSEAEEKRLLDESLLKRMKTYQEQAKKELERISKTNKEEIEKKLEEIRKKIDEIENQAPEGEESPEAFRSRWAILRPLYEEQRALEERINPYNRLVYSLIVSLSPQQLLELERRHRLVFSTRPTRAQYAYPPSAQNVVASVLNEIIELQKIELAEQQKYIEQRKAQARGDEDVIVEAPWGVKVFEMKDVAAVRVVLNAPELGRENGLMNTEVKILGINGDILLEETRTVANSDKVTSKIPFLDYEVSDDKPQNTENKEVLKKEENQTSIQDQLDKPLDSERFEKARGNANFPFPVPVPSADIANFLKPGSTVDPLSPVGFFLNEAASQSDVALIADAYDSYMEVPLPVGNDIKTARKLFDAYGKSTDCEWKFENGWVTIRNREWALARAFSVPRNILFSIRDAYFTQCGLNFEQMAWLASSITDRQVTSPVLMFTAGPWFWEMGDSEGLGFLRMWANLSPVQKKRLIEGGMLLFTDLNPIAKNHLSEYIYRKGSIDNGPDFAQMFFEEDFDEASKELQRDVGAITFDMNMTDTEVTQILPDGVPPGTEIVLTVKQRQGLATLLKFTVLGGMEFPLVIPTKMFADFEEWTSSEGGMGMDEFFTLEKDRIKPATLEMWNFELKLLPERKVQVFFGCGYSNPAHAFGTFENLPPEMQKKIAKQREEIRGRKRDDGDGGKEAR
ncbi:MAG TPA: hypothetical protein VNK96_06080 [Fimbriimonadales bacterium]|nr:hypothetical protein [Fimbriimonadales bacterium]